jgi:hypothetical protein
MESRKKYKFKELAKKTQQITINKKAQDNRVVLKNNKIFHKKKAKKKKNQVSN